MRRQNSSLGAVVFLTIEKAATRRRGMNVCRSRSLVYTG